MRWDLIVALGWIIGMMVSPEALTLQGNFTGLTKMAFVVPLIGAMGLHGLNSYGYRHGNGTTRITADDEMDLLTHAFGRFGASALLLLARPAMAICLATATLVTAGFVFNETFVYWFPNFAFAGALLILVFSANMVGSKGSTFVQLISSAVAVLGILTLTIAGLLLDNDLNRISLHPIAMPNAFGSFLALLLFLGYDLWPYTWQGSRPKPLTKPIWAGLVLIATLFLMWNAVSLKYVSPDRLSTSSIPHILTAKAIAGQTGRYLIGIASISGTIAAVNLLFHAVCRMGTLLVQRQLPAASSDHIDKIFYGFLFFLTLTTGLLMATGFAGSDYLDITIHAGLLLWLVFHAMTQLAHLMADIKPALACKSQVHLRATLRPVLLLAIMFSAVLTLVYHNEKPLVLLAVMALITAMAAALAGVGIMLAKYSALRFQFPRTDK